MSNCTGCYHARNDVANSESQKCQICIRNPEYPSKKLPERANIGGIILEVPQDMYIAKDRKKFEEELLKQKLNEMLQLRKVKPKRKYPDVVLPWEKEDEPENPWDPYTPFPWKKKKKPRETWVKETRYEASENVPEDQEKEQ